MVIRTGLLAVAGLALSLTSAIATTDETTSLVQIMQGLRAGITEISDGLLTDDFDKVANGAAAIADHPPIPAAQVQLVVAELGPQMAQFKQFDKLVHDQSLKIVAAARASDRGAAVAGYKRVFDGCVACHVTFMEPVRDALSSTTGQPSQ